MATEFVTIKHPDQESTGRSSRQAFEEVWKDKGFELVDEEAEQPVTAEEQPAETSRSRYQREESSEEQGD